MAPIDAGSARELLTAIVTAFSIIGGGMASFSGYGASQALAKRESPQAVAHTVNEGIGLGFELFAPLSIVALIIMVWS